MKDPLFFIAAATGGFMLSLATASIIHATPVTSLETLGATTLQQSQTLGATSLQQSQTLGVTSLQQPIYIDERGSCTLIGD